MGFSTLTYNIHTHRFGSKSTNEKPWLFFFASQVVSFFLAIPRVTLPNQTVGFLMSIFGKWNEQIICKLFFSHVLQTIKCMSVVWVVFRVFRGVLGMKTLSLLCFLGRTVSLPKCGVKPVRSQQDWLLVRRNSWNCPSTLCHTRKNHHHSSLCLFGDLY